MINFIDLFFYHTEKRSGQIPFSSFLSDLEFEFSKPASAGKPVWLPLIQHIPNYCPPKLFSSGMSVPLSVPELGVGTLWSACTLPGKHCLFPSIVISHVGVFIEILLPNVFLFFFEMLDCSILGPELRYKSVCSVHVILGIYLYVVYVFYTVKFQCNI